MVKLVMTRQKTLKLQKKMRWEEKRRWRRSYKVRSCIPAFGAFSLTEAIPFLHPGFASYASLVAIISPFGAFSLNLNFPFLSLNSSNSGFGNFSPCVSIV